MMAVTQLCVTAITDGSIILFLTSYNPYLAGSAAYLAGLITVHLLAYFKLALFSNHTIITV